MNSKLHPMNNTYRSIRLQSGQSLAVDRRRPARLFVTEGEVLLETPAAWLGGKVVLAPAWRVAAPAELNGAEITAIHATGAAKVLVEEVPGALAKLKSAWDEIRFGWFRFPWLSRE